MVGTGRPGLRHIWQGNTVAAAVGLLLLSLLLSACRDTGGGAQPPVGPTGSGSPEALAKVLVLDFEQSMPPLSAGAKIPSGIPNGPRGEVAMAGRNARPLQLVTGRDGLGHAVAFPAQCLPGQAKTCPKEIIEVYPSTTLAAGTHDFGWGASIRLKQEQTAKGSNIIQKGFSLGGGSQWKLQVDGAQGHPSCVLVGMNETLIHEAFADFSISDGSWHDVICRRSGDQLVITVDGAHKGTAHIAKGLTIAPAGPVRIGGKDLKADNDQFFGSLDDIYVETHR